MTRKWLITIVVAIVVILVGIWLYTGYAADEVEPEVAEDEAVSVGVAAPATAVPPIERIATRESG